MIPHCDTGTCQSKKLIMVSVGWLELSKYVCEKSLTMRNAKVTKKSHFITVQKISLEEQVSLVNKTKSLEPIFHPFLILSSYSYNDFAYI